MTTKLHDSIDFTKYTILIADDTVSNIQVLGNTLRDYGFNLYIATDGQRAYDLANEVKPDLILLDIMMPKMNGYDVCLKLQQNNETEEIPVIFITALTETDKIVKGFETGGVDYITKPFQTSEVIARIKNQLALIDTRKKLKNAYDVILRDINGVNKIQKDILPKNNLDIGELRFNWLLQPSSTFSGDTLNYFKINEDQAVFYIADVNGTGMPATYMALLINRVINNLIKNSSPTFNFFKSQRTHKPSEIANLLNERILATGEGMDYFSILIGVANLKKKRLYLSQAGTIYVYLVYKNGEITRLMLEGTRIGLVPNAFYEDDEIRFDEISRIIAVTDGLLETQNSNDEKFSSDKLKEYIKYNLDLDNNHLLDNLLKDAKSWQGNDNFDDDITLLGLEIR